MPYQQTDFLAILRSLTHSGADFVVVGGVAAVMQGAPIATFDVDVVHSRTPGNIDRLLTALQGLDATYRAAGDRALRPDASHSWRQLADALRRSFLAGKRRSPVERPKGATYQLREASLSSPGHQLLITRFGPLDLLGHIGAGHEYEELAEHATVADGGSGLRFRALDLAWVIKTKEETAGEKDTAMLSVLRRTLLERSQPHQT